jgi:NAD(P)-dependent dehydrogenase (short-subunit alcohol dehydrogenase family)
VAGAELNPFASFRLDGKVAVVTGASAGLGRRFARVLDAAGAKVVVVARRHERLEQLAGELSDALPVQCDLSQPDSLGIVVDSALDRYGRLDVLVNNAGVVDVHPAEDEPLDFFRHTIDVNLVAPFGLAQHAARTMLGGEGGTIVNVASILGLVGVGQIPQAGYAASKGGIVTLTRGGSSRRWPSTCSPRRAGASSGWRDARRWAGEGAKGSSTAPCCSWPATPVAT